MRIWQCVVAVTIPLMGCSPAKAEYSAAVEAAWNSERYEFAQKAVFYDKFAASFESGAERAQRIADRLGTGGSIAEGQRGTASESRAQADDALYLSKSTFVGLKEWHCVSAASLPGQNCEVLFTIRGPDGKEEGMTKAYRFDKRGGKLAVVGPAESS